MRTDNDRAFEQADIAEKLACVLDGMKAEVYVTDLVSNEILYVNRETRRRHGEQPLAGKVCWRALGGFERRCESCPIPYLLKNPGKDYHAVVCGEEQFFWMYDSIIPWLGGKLAHLHYGISLD